MKTFFSFYPLSIKLPIISLFLFLSVNAEAKIFTVNSNNDVDDGICNGTHCSLREAIDTANNVSGKDTIYFNITGCSPSSRKIIVTSELPEITDTVLIDGTSQNCNRFGNSHAKIILQGDGSSPWVGLDLRGNGHHELYGMYITGFMSGVELLFSPTDHCTIGAPGKGNVISGNDIGFLGEGLRIRSNYNLIQSNVFGLDTNISSRDSNYLAGIVITSSGRGNKIGGTTAAERNYLSGNEVYGIEDNGNSDTIIGNFIGVGIQGDETNLQNKRTGITLISTDSTVIGGPNNGEGNVISGNGLFGISSTLSDDVIIKGNWIGTDSGGTKVVGNLSSGIFVNGSDWLIGGTAVGDRNIISGNDIGIEFGIGEVRTKIQGNFIGVDGTGLLDFGNAFHGIRADFADEILIGGDIPGAGNIISGNGRYGIAVNSDCRIQGNIIGLGKDGSTVIGNDSTGIHIVGNKDTIGGSSAVARNIISGNGAHGIYVLGDSTLITGNYIGTDSAGTLVKSNGRDGIFLIYCSLVHIVGGSTATEGNIVSGNAANGIAIYSSDSIIVQGNCIGTDQTGSIDLGNAYNGIYIEGSSLNHLIGGHMAAASNKIAYNQQEGIHITGSAADNHSIRRNAIYCNDSAKGILLTSQGNENKTAPIITGMISTDVTGMAAANDTIEVFYTDNVCNKCQQGKTYIGTTIADSSGAWTLSGTFAPGAPVTATATDANGNTSEFAICLSAQKDSIFAGFSADTVCFGDSTHFTDLSTPADSILSWHWDFGDGDTAIIQHPVHLYKSSGTFSVELIVSSACTNDTITKTALVYPGLIVNAGNNDTLCPGGTVAIGGAPTASGGSGTFSYSWTPSNGLSATNVSNPLATPSTLPQTYFLKVTDSAGCMSTDSIHISMGDSITALIDVEHISCYGLTDGSATVTASSGAPPLTYIWSGGGTNSSKTGLNSGSHTVSITDARGCTRVESIFINEPDTFNVSDSIAHTSCFAICDGKISFTISGGTPPHSFSWNTLATTNIIDSLCSGNYSVVITDSNNCTKQMDYTINTPAKINLSFSGRDSICQGDTSFISVSGAQSYLWSDGSTHDTLLVNADSSSWYFVTATNQNNCTGVDSFFIYVGHGSAAIINGPAEVCEGETVTLISDPANHYHWSTGETTQKIVLTPNNNDTIQLIIDECGTDTTQHVLTVLPHPNVKILPDVDDTVVCLGNVITLQGEGANDYLWAPTDLLDCFDCPTTSLTVEKDITYILQGTDADQCIAYDTITIFLDPSTRYFVPNAFSPNADGFNDIFYVRVKGYVALNLSIYTRWGERVFSTTDPDVGWDGAYRGKLLNDVVVTYALDIGFNNGQEIRERGNITIVR